MIANNHVSVGVKINQLGVPSNTGLQPTHGVHNGAKMDYFVLFVAIIIANLNRLSLVHGAKDRNDDDADSRFANYVDD